MRLVLVSSVLLMMELNFAAVFTEQPDVITATSLNSVTLCQPMAVVEKAFPESRDIRISSEGSEWPAKIVELKNGERILFESSRTDPIHIGRISTNSPLYLTRRGYRVGTSIADLLGKGERLDFSYPEGYLSITITSENIGFQVDDDSATKFWKRFDYSGDPLQVLDHNARIKEFTITGKRCEKEIGD
jgi:hypothetical protein